MGFFDRFKGFGKQIKNSYQQMSLSLFDKLIEQFYFKNYDTESGVQVNEETAQKLSVVSTCIKLISNDLAMLPLEIRKYRDVRNPSQGTDLAIEHPLFNVFRYMANGYSTSFNYKERIVFDLQLSGNSYSLKYINNRGQVIALKPLPWQNIEVEVKGNKIYYNYHDYEKQTKKRYSKDFIFHISNGGGDEFIGKSPISIVREQIATGLNTEKFFSKFAKQGLNTGHAITMPTKIKDKEAVRKELKEKYGGMENTGKPLILEDGMAIQNLKMPLNDAEFIEQRKLTDLQIASFYRIPAYLIGNYENSTFNNQEQQALSYVKHCLQPVAERIESFINCHLLSNIDLQEGYFAQYDFTRLLRGDANTRATYYHSLRQDGVVTTNEIRNAENMNPSQEDGSDNLFINGNMRKLTEPYNKNGGGIDE